MQQIGSAVLFKATSGIRRRLFAARLNARTWARDRRVAIGAGLSLVAFACALLSPMGWVRGPSDAVVVNLIDFFTRGVLVPQLIFLVATGINLMTSWRWLPSAGILCVSTAWYAGVLTSATWLFFVEHVEARISTTFLELWTPERTLRVLEVVARPLEAFTSPFALDVMVRGASGSGTPEATILWRNFVLAALAVYTVLPRVALLGFTAARRLFFARAGAALREAARWQPAFAQPAPDSLDWFEIRGEEQQCIHAFIAAGLRGRPEQEPHLRALSPEWLKVAESATAFSEFLGEDFARRCPMAGVLAFDAARFELAKDAAGESLKWSYAMALRRALTPIALDWFKIERALRDVPALEKQLAKEPFSWKRWLSIAGLGAVGVGAGVALAPFVGAATIAVAGITVAKGSAASAILVAAGGGALGATTGAAIPLAKDADRSVLIPVLARQIALVTAGLVPQATVGPLRLWLERSLEAEPSRPLQAARRILLEKYDAEA